MYHPTRWTPPLDCELPERRDQGLVYVCAPKAHVPGTHYLEGGGVGAATRSHLAVSLVPGLPLVAEGGLASERQNRKEGRSKPT